MKHMRLISLSLLAAMGLTQGTAWAQPARNNDGRCGPGEPNCESTRDNGRSPNRSHPTPFEPGRDSNRQQDMAGRQHDGEQGAGPDRNFYRGERLPSQYRGSRYVVNDWRGHGLRQPPRGYHWVQTGGDYVLVAIATGVILELLLNR